MELKVGDVVEFKKYEDLDVDERVMIAKDFFPSYGKVKEINVNGLDEFFSIVGSQLIFSKKSVARVIGKGVIGEINIGDEVLIKTTVGEVKGNDIWVSWISKNNVVEVLKRKKSEHFIVRENYYGMYVHDLGVFTLNKEDAKIYSSRDEANEEAKEMPLNSWKVIQYGA